MKPAILLLVVLLAGCATDAPVPTTDAAWRKKYINEYAVIPPEPIMPSPPAPCVDTRWGKCEEHGEWWIKADQAYIPAEYMTIQRDGARRTEEMKMRDAYWIVSLICPRGHYIEREIEGATTNEALTKCKKLGVSVVEPSSRPIVRRPLHEKRIEYPIEGPKEKP